MTGYNDYSYILPYDSYFTMTFSIWDVGDAEINSGLLIDNIQLSPVPAPPAIWLFGIGMIGLVGFSKRRKAVSN